MRPPSKTELRPGHRRDLVDFLFMIWREADRPSLDRIEKTIEAADYPGDASAETIRRMLKGTNFPTRWANAETVFLALCQLAKRDPDGPAPDDSDGDDWLNARERMRYLWNKALDEPEVYYSDPWSEAPF
jgi:hypothetical protein